MSDSSAQQTKNQLAVILGGEFIPSSSVSAPAANGTVKVDYSSSFALDLAYGRRIYNFRHAVLWLDVPAVVGPSHTVSNGAAALPTSLATFFVAPSLNLELRGRHALTPWVSAGGGYGLFETSQLLRDGTANPKRLTSTGVLQFGAGVDVKTPLHLLSIPVGLRGEVRDFYAFDSSAYSTGLNGQGQHHITVGGGVTARF